MERDEHGDLVSDRGFRQTQWIDGVEGYGGRVVVYESSGAAAPRVWLRIDEEPGRYTGGGDPVDASIHLEVAAALVLAENIMRVCEKHYQLGGTPSDE